MMLISDRYIRIDETDEGGGYIIYDDKDKVIYSDSHLDQSIMLIKPFKFIFDNVYFLRCNIRIQPVGGILSVT